jgi:hypothetical protein
MDRGILYNSEMVRAILDGRKTQTRRIIKPQPTVYPHGTWNWPHKAKGILRYGMSIDYMKEQMSECCPYGVVGDRLYVREKMYTLKEEALYYSVDNSVLYPETGSERSWIHKRKVHTTIPSIHIPKWAARIFLPITGIGVERVQDISEEDAKAEGCKPENAQVNCSGGAYRNGFCGLWDSINAKRGFGWDKNPYVWKIQFER